MRESKIIERYLKIFQESHDDVADAIRDMDRLLGEIEATRGGNPFWQALLTARKHRTRQEYRRARGQIEKAQSIAGREHDPFAKFLWAAVHGEMGLKADCKKCVREAFVTYEEMIAQLESGNKCAPRVALERIAKARLCMSLLHVNLGQFEKAEDTAGELLDEFGPSCGKRFPKDSPIPGYLDGAVRVYCRAALGRGRTREAAYAEVKKWLRRPDPRYGDPRYYAMLEKYLDWARLSIPEKRASEMFASMSDQEKRTRDFLAPKSNFRGDLPLLFILREWNSFTPAVPDDQELDRGGGYFVHYQDLGIVIDPGYDFLENLYRAGGRIHDITHVIVTHAHDDHTAELETILMLANRYNRDRTPEKKLKLYLSQGAERKFAGLIPLRGCDHIGPVVTLSRAEPESIQKIPLWKNDGEAVRLWVLPAYHDDVITRDTAIGVALEFCFSDGERRFVVFTGDTSVLKTDMGRKTADESEDSTTSDRPLFEAYPDDLKGGRIDLLVAHIGSVKRHELEPLTFDEVTGRRHRRLYPHHLGLLGMLVLLDQLRPKVALISEFGEELKRVRLELVRKIREATTARQSDQGVSDKQQTRVFTGDLVTVCNLHDRTLFCHETGEFLPPDRIGEFAEDAPEAAAGMKPTERAFLFRSDAPGQNRGRVIDEYYRGLKDRRLKYFRRGAAKGKRAAGAVSVERCPHRRPIGDLAASAGDFH